MYVHTVRATSMDKRIQTQARDDSIARTHPIQ